MNNPDRPKTPDEYRSLAQLTPKGLSADYLNYLFFSMPLETLSGLLQRGELEKAARLFGIIKAGMISTPSYSDKYLNEQELEQAREHGVAIDDLINDNTKPAIKRLDEIAQEVKQIGSEITMDNYNDFFIELKKLYQEAERLIGYNN